MLKKSTVMASLALIGSSYNADCRAEEFKSPDISASRILSTKSNLKIAVVNQFDVGASEAGLEAKKLIEIKHKELSEKLQKTAQQLAKADNDFKNKANMMSNSAREQAQKDLVRLKNEHTTKTEECELDLQSTMREATESVVKEFQVCLNEVALTENLDLVLDMDGKILYAKKDLDLTPSVVNKMNNKRSTKITSAPSVKKAEVKKAA